MGDWLDLHSVSSKPETSTWTILCELSTDPFVGIDRQGHWRLFGAMIGACWKGPKNVETAAHALFLS